MRRFGGVLELFSEVDIVGAPGPRRGLPVLQEAVLQHPFAQIREIPIRIATPATGPSSSMSGWKSGWSRRSCTISCAW